MGATICRYCGSSNLKHKEIEIRHVNSNTMQIKQLRKVIELECRVCGWVGDQETDNPARCSMMF